LFGSETVIGIVLGGLLSGAGFVLKRWITRERDKEHVAELSVLATVASQMRATGVSMEEIEALKKYLRQGHRVENSTAPSPVPDRPVTQLEMNEAAARDLKKLDDEMYELLRTISLHLDENEKAELDAAQRKWETFRDAHAEFVSKIFEGGSMRPLWFITSVDIATRDRLNELRTYLDVRQES
jgi:uncharacterized protein YecT (DUF1311 family)